MSKRIEKTSGRPKRGFVKLEGRDLYIRKGFVLVPCTGEAHGPNGAYIDNCGICAPLWGEVAVPEGCASLSDYREKRFAARAIGTFFGGFEPFR